MEPKYAEKPPHGVHPDYEHPVRNPAVTRLEVVAPTLMGIAAIFVALRLYVRRFLVNSMGWDDFAIFVSLLLTAATIGCALTTARYGLGYHLYVIPYHEFSPKFLKWELALQEVYTSASLSVRVAICLLVLRIVSPVARYRWLIYALLFIITAYHLAKAFAFFFGCVPIALNWNISLAETGHCIDRFKLAVAFNALNVITDVFLWTIPIPVVWNLQMRTQYKLEVLSVFAVGLVIIAISIYRCIIQNTLVGIKDVTWYYPDVHLWACIELEVGIICGCMPPLKTLFPRMFPATWFSKNTKSSSGSHRLTSLSTIQKKGFSHLDGSTTNRTLIGGTPARRPSNPKVPDWYDVESGRLGSKGVFDDSMGPVENTVISVPPNVRTHSPLNNELQARGIPSPERDAQHVIHKQQEFMVLRDDELPRAL